MKNVFRTIATFLTVALLAVSFTATSQEDVEPVKKKHNFSPYWYATANAGISTFFGDVQSNNFFQKYQSEYRISTGLFLGRQLTPVFGLRGNAQYGRLHSLLQENQDGTASDLVMDAWHLYETTIQGTVDFTNLFAGYNPDRVVSVYGFLGVGFANWESELYHLADLRASGVNNIPTPDQVEAVAIGQSGTNDSGNGLAGHTTEIVVPFGAGVAFNVTDQIAIGLEQAWKPVNSDLLDTKAGVDGFDYDVFGSTTVNLTFNFKDLGSTKKMAKNHELVEYTPDKKVLERHGDEVEVKIEGSFPEDYFNKKAAMKFVPVLKYGDKTKELKSITLRGEKVQGDGKVINAENGGKFSYTDVIPYEEGMENAVLVVYPVLYTPKKDPADNGMSVDALVANYKGITVDEVKLADATIVTPQRVNFIPSGPFGDDVFHNAAIAPSGYEKVTVISEEGTLYFRVNKANLNMWLPQNKNDEAKAKLQKMKDFVEQGWDIKDIDINAWASPEGEESFNEGLSEKRAQTGLKYMTKYFKKLNKKKDSELKIADPANEIKWNTYARGEDWNGFLTSVQESGLKDKNIILNVVKSQPDLASREQEIRNMTLVYKEIEDDILPPLRRVDFTVNLFQPKKTEAQISDLALTDPDQLKIVELLYAAELTTDDDTRLKIYETIITKEPRCWKSKNNAAFIYMKKGDFKKATELLEQAKEQNAQSGEVHNNLGLIAAMNKDYTAAKEYFNNAAKLGVNTNYNMGVIMITEGEYDKAIAKMGQKKCDYNVALALIAKGDIAKAKNVLDCAAKTASTYYLMAVVEARANNAEGVYANLTKAVEKCEKVKTMAKDDREFIQFYNEVDFQNILK